MTPRPPTGPGGQVDEGAEGKRAREVPIIEELRPMVTARLDAAANDDSRLFVARQPETHRRSRRCRGIW